MYKPSLIRIPAQRILSCGSNRQIHMDHRNSVEKKGWHGYSLSERGREVWRECERESQPPAWTGFYYFSRHLTSRMVLIYYAQVCFGWLSFTDSKGEDVAKYIKDICNVKGEMVKTDYAPYLEGLAQISGS